MMRRAYATQRRRRGSREVRPFRSGRAPRSPEPSFGGSRGSMRHLSASAEKISGGEGFFFPANRNPTDFLLVGSIRPTLPQRANWREGGPRARRPRAATRARASSGRARQTCLRSSRGGTRRATSSGARRALPPPSLPPRSPARAVSEKCTSRRGSVASSRRATANARLTAPSPRALATRRIDVRVVEITGIPAKVRRAALTLVRRRESRAAPPTPVASPVSVPSGCHVAVGQPRPDPRLNLHA